MILSEEQKQKYMSNLDGMDMTREQKIDFIDNLWNFCQHFVDSAWDEDKKNEFDALLKRVEEN